MAIEGAELAVAYVSLVPSVRGMRREIDRELGDAGDQAAKAGDDAGEGFTTGFGTKLAAFGAAAGLALGAALIKGTFDAIDREAQNDLLASRIGLTPEESERVGRVAGELYAQAYGESLAEVNDAIQAINSNIGDLGDFDDDSLVALGALALDTSRILGEDVSRSVRGVGQLLRNNLADNAESGFDLVIAAAQRLPQEMQGELVDTVEEYSGAFNALGLTGSQALGAVVAAVEAGARNTDLAADAFNEFSIRAIDGSKLTGEAYQQLGFDAEEMAQRIANGGPEAAAATSEIIQAISGIGDQVLQEEIGVALFGTQFEQLGADVLTAMDPATASLGDFRDAASEAGDVLNDNLSTRLESLKRRGLQGLAEIAERFVVPALESFATLVEDLSSAFGENGLAGVLDVIKQRLEPVISFVRDNAELFAGFGAAILAILVPAFISWAVSAGAAAIATIAAAAPVIAVAAAIGLLAAGLVYAYRNNETFRRVVDKAADILKNKVVPAIKAVVGWITHDFIPAIVDAVGWIKDNIVPAIEDYIAAILNIAETGYAVVEDIIAFFGDIVSFVQDLPGNIAEAAAGMWDGITQPFRDAMDAIRELWNSTVGGFSVTIPDWVPTYGGRGFTIPKLHSGIDEVPGRPGTEHLYVLEAGERVLSVGQTDAMDTAMANPSQGAGVHIDTVNVVERPWLEEFTESVHLYPVAA